MSVEAPCFSNNIYRPLRHQVQSWGLDKECLKLKRTNIITSCCVRYSFCYSHNTLVSKCPRTWTGSWSLGTHTRNTSIFANQSFMPSIKQSLHTWYQCQMCLLWTTLYKFHTAALSLQAAVRSLHPLSLLERPRLRSCLRQLPTTRADQQTWTGLKIDWIRQERSFVQ